jgi:glyoxylase-like metal-dependent hydrolase (beta-lactamase superfamily II)
MKKLTWMTVFVVVSMTACDSNKEEKMVAPVYDDALLQKIRNAASAVPGALPLQINYLKYAASIRKWKDLVDGGGDDAATMARTAFQVEYADGFIMIDAGMDKAVHHFFEKDGPQPFDDTLANKVAVAVQQARMILVTHEHGDHVGGVIRYANNTIPGKTILTREQVNTLITEPQMPEIKLDAEKSRQYLVAEFESVFPVAPGVVLIKAPGHTKGEIMIYVKTQAGREYIFTGDVTWSFKGVQEKKPKPDSEIKRIGEDADLVEQQLAWLHDRLTKDKMIILVSHDDIMLPQYAAQGLIRHGLR